MNTKNCVMAKVTGVLVGVASLLMAGLVNAATVSVLPTPVSGNVGDALSVTVVGSEFPDGVVAGSILLTWDAAILSLNTTLTDAQIDGIISTGFSDVLTFSSTPGQLAFTAALGISAPTVGVGGVAFDFLNLSFTALTNGSTTASIGVGPDGDWVDGNLAPVVGVTYVPATVNVGAVPVPAAIWLFGSGLIGMIAISRRRKPQLVC